MSDTNLRILTPLFTHLQGKRIIVRPFDDNDAEALFNAVNESKDHLRLWLSAISETHHTIEGTLNLLRKWQASWILREDMHTGLWEQESGRFLGCCGLHVRDWECRSFEIGYWLRASATGKGYMTEAVNLLTDFAFQHLQANRVQIHCDERNHASAAVAYRAGYMLEGVVRNHSFDGDGNLRNVMMFSRIPDQK
jgi:RimJ/RimL family protein N-acetyltransferase